MRSLSLLLSFHSLPFFFFFNSSSSIPYSLSFPNHMPVLGSLPVPAPGTGTSTDIGALSMSPDAW